MKTVASRYDEYINVKDLVDKINRALAAAKKDNDFIYHDRVPDLKDLEPIGKASLVKSTPVVVPLSQKFTGKQSVWSAQGNCYLVKHVVSKVRLYHAKINIYFLHSVKGTAVFLKLLVFFSSLLLFFLMRSVIKHRFKILT